MSFYKKIINLSILILLLFLTNLSFALDGITFLQTFGGDKHDYGQSVIELSDAGFAVCGDGYSFSPSTDIYLVKLNAIGEIIWFRNYGGTGVDSSASVKEVSGGGFAIIGSTNSYSGINENDDIYLIRTDANGKMLWNKTYGGAENEYGVSVLESDAGGFIVAGWKESFDTTIDKEIILIKTDADGEVLWKKTYGGMDDEIPTSLIATSDGNYAVCGQTSSFGAGDFDALLIKIDTEGNEIWRKTYGWENIEYAYSVQETDDGGFILGGISNSKTKDLNYDALLVKTDSNGEMVWSNTYGGPISVEKDMFGDEIVTSSDKDDRAFSVIQTMDGAYVFVGDTNSYGYERKAILLVKVNSTGKKIWEKKINGFVREQAKSVYESMDGGLVICGTTESAGRGKSDLIILKTDPNGNLDKAKIAESQAKASEEEESGGEKDALEVSEEPEELLTGEEAESETEELSIADENVFELETGEKFRGEIKLFNEEVEIIQFEKADGTITNYKFHQLTEQSIAKAKKQYDATKRFKDEREITVDIE